MEGEESKLQEASSETLQDSSRRTRVGFPQVREEKKGKGKFVFIILAILALSAVGAWLIFGQKEDEETMLEPTPTIFQQPASQSPTPVQIDRKEVKIQVLNGSGIAGAAGDFKEELEDLGYADITAGNASTQDYTNTEVTFATGVTTEVKDEITDKLEEIFVDVDVKSGSVGEYDLRIVTGLPKGYTPTPTKPAATSTPASTPTSKVTGTITPTSTPTTTP
jgi:hypothetical protein